MSVDDAVEAAIENWMDDHFSDYLSNYGVPCENDTAGFLTSDDLPDVPSEDTIVDLAEEAADRKIVDYKDSEAFPMDVKQALRGGD